MDKVVKEIQSQLKNKGFDPGPIDGDLGPKTLAAMKSYLASNVTPVKQAVVEKAKEVTQKVVEVVKPPPPVPEFDANTLKGKDRPLFAKKTFMELGWKDYQAAAMTGQFMQESYQDLRTNVWGDNHSAFGIGQWRDYGGQPGRLTDLFKFAQGRGKPIDDLETQIRFADWELTKGSEKGLGKLLKATNNIDEALDIAIGYERPRNYTKENPRAGHGYENRAKFAKSLM